MGAACTRDAAKHLENPMQPPTLTATHSFPSYNGGYVSNLPLATLLAEATSRLCVYQNTITLEYVLLPTDADDTVGLGPNWSRLSPALPTQATALDRTSKLTALRPPPTLPGTPERHTGRLPDLPPSLPPPRPAGPALPAPPPGPPSSTSRGLKCRVCEREVPTKAMLQEHLNTCLLVADARGQARGSDEGLKVVLGELRRILEEKMNVMLHTGPEGGNGGRIGGRKGGRGGGGAKKPHLP
ncbi:hypothetical protein Naga_100715g1 [Nannochloropsis gaditana]|uniref:Uncharacterized protein n=1 Tax=Nannochloropsis gaditana TaxID=72520 RepID=W7TS91_9STRA|nr:hypothetical protein Naga_100715g1 [Nannochloropsis gaditana]